MLSSDTDDLPSRVLPWDRYDLLERRSDGKPGAQLSLPAVIFPSVSGDNIDAAASTYRLAFCLKLQHRRDTLGFSSPFLDTLT